MNRLDTSASDSRFIAPERTMTWTFTPSDEKTWANSVAMNPPPRMIISSGSFSSRMMSLLVRYFTPDSRTKPGTLVREPAAMMIWSAVISISSSPWPVRMRRGPTKTAWRS